LFFGALLPGDLRPRHLFLYFALSCSKFAIQIDAAYLIGWLMSLQYMLIPAVGVYKDTTGTMENNPVIKQWISAHSAIHLLTSYNIAPQKLRFSGDPDLSASIPRIPMKKNEVNSSRDAN
jgi:hypothetical protein